MFPNWLLNFFLGGSGLILGSFLGVVSDRVPNDRTLTGRSKCESCGKTLRFFELVPVLSFVFLGGKCLGCKKRIPWHLPFFEVVTSVLFVCVGLFFQNFSSPLVWAWVFLSLLVVCVSVVVFWVDLKEYLILDVVVIPSVILSVFSRMLISYLGGNFFSLNSEWVVCILIAGLLFALLGGLYSLSKGKWFGFGDVKLLVFLSVVFGFKVFLILWLASVLASIWSVFLLMRKKATLKSKLPFGSFLAVASIVFLFVMGGVSEIYLNILMP
jgi:prepilin signal peptidase PulO-like enzyme (type II secretory pathway)